MMKKLQEILDIPSFLVAISTLLLFIFALFTKKILHDVLLEAAIFLISLKLIISSYKQNVSSKQVEKMLKDIQDRLDS